MLGLQDNEAIERYSSLDNYKKEQYSHKFGYICFSVNDEHEYTCLCGKQTYSSESLDSQNLDIHLYGDLDDAMFCVYYSISDLIPFPREDSANFLILDSRGYIYNHNYLDVMLYYKPCLEYQPIHPLDMDLIYSLHELKEEFVEYKRLYEKKCQLLEQKLKILEK